MAKLLRIVLFLAILMVTLSTTGNTAAAAEPTSSSPIIPEPDCDADAAAVTNGTIAYNGSSTAPHASGTTGTVSCHEGYTISGSPTITCTAGNWSTPPSCTPNGCADAAAITNGTIAYNDGSAAPHTSGTTGTVTCESGYTRSGAETITCTAENWSTPPSCTPNGCADAAAITNGTIAYNDDSAAPHTSGTTGTVTCESGYTRSGAETITCTAEKWSTPPSCTPNGCADAAAITNGTIAYNDDSAAPHTSGTTGRVTCESGYTRSGAETITCTAEKWSTPPSCTPNGCTDAAAITNGTIAYNDDSAAPHTSGTTGRVTCESGYTRSGAETITCTAEKWSTPPSCTPNGCADASAITNGTIAYNDDSAAPHTSGTTGTVTCESGYTRSGAETITCTAEKWSTPPSCTPNGCADAAAITNGTIAYNDDSAAPHTSGTTGRVTCESGYTRSGAETITCTAEKWSTPPSCTPNGCADAAAITNGTIAYNDDSAAPHTSGTTGTVTCESGYTRSGAETITCTAEKWSTPPSCTPNGCADAAAITNGAIAYSNGSAAPHTSGTTGRVTCESGYTRSGAETITCTAEKWSTPPSCTLNEVGFGDPCNITDQCTTVADAICNMTCTCNDTMYYSISDVKCFTKKQYNEFCDENDKGQCVTSGATCSTDHCLCVDNTFHFPENDSCVTKIPLTAVILTQTTSNITLRLTAGNEPTDGFRVCMVSGSCMDFPRTSGQTWVDAVFHLGLTDMTCYNFTVQATQGSTNNSHTVTVEGCTSPSALINLRQDIGSLSARTAIIRWDWPNDLSNGVEFKATFLNITYVFKSMNNCDATGRCSAELSGLKPSTDTNILLYAVFKNITGPAAHLTIKTTVEAPYNCTPMNSTSTSVVLQWTAGEGTYGAFMILYTGGARIADPERNHGSTMQQYPLEHLQPGTKYSIDVLVFWSGSEFIRSNPCTCDVYTLPVVPTNLGFSDIHTDEFTVTWDKGANSNDDYYEVTVERVGNSSVVYESTETNTRAVVDGLDAATQYQVFVVAVKNLTANGKELSLKSPGNITKVTFTRPTPPPSGTNITDVTEFSFDIHWNEHWSSYFEHYSIDVSPGDGGNTNITILSNITTYTVSNLRSGVFYTVSIYTVVSGLRSETPINGTSYTVPERPDSVPEPSGSNLSSDGMIVSWDGTNDRFSDWHIHIISDTDDLVVNFTVPGNKTTFDVDSLTSGTLYTLVVFTSVPGFRSQNNFTWVLHTRPSDLTSASITSIHETNFTVILVEPDERFDDYHVTIAPAPSDRPSTYNISRQTGQFTQRGLDAATNYTMTIYTVLYVDDGELRSSSPYTLLSHTGPKPPKPVSIRTVLTDSISISVSGSDSVFDSYIVKYTHTGVEKNETANNDSDEITVHNLTPGTLYSFTIYTVWQGTESDTYVSTSSHTRPNPASNILFSSATTTTMTVTWEAPSVGDVDGYTVVFICQSPNEGRVIQNHTETTTSTTATAGRLDPGTFCTVMVTTYAGNQAGDQLSKDISKSTLETAPGAVTAFLIDAVTSNSLDVLWTTPSTRNGIIRRYEVQVKMDTLCVKRFLLRCSDCPAANQDVSHEDDIGCGSVAAPVQTYGRSDDQHNVTVSDLHPYRNYTILVIAYTVQWGASVTNITQTQQDLPGIPRNFNITTYTHNEVEFTWRPPSEINGEITGYRIVSSYKERLCGNKEGSDSSVFEDSVTDVSDTRYTFNKNIYPYWKYSFQIKAITSVGYGPLSNPIAVRTSEYNPEPVAASGVDITNITATGFTISWQPSCFPNGIITNYNICLSNDSSVQHGESLWSECYSRTPSPTTAWLDTVIPYRNYSVTISAQNLVGFGAPSTKQTFMSKIAKPEVPSNITPQTVTSSTIQLTWSKPDTFTGPTLYRVTATDGQTTQQTHWCQTDIANWTDKLASSCVVNGLDAYWNYSLVLKATVDDGEGNTLEESSPALNWRTDEAIPGNVTDLELIPEPDVTKPRTITVTWQPPTKRDLNGVLTGYMLYYINKKTTESLSIADLGVDRTSYVIRGTPAGYTIQVAAINKAGVGLNVTKPANLTDGAPIKLIDESAGQLLMQPASISVPDKQKQVAVKLPLASFLCNSTSGVPEEWGIIVAEASEATDVSFTGSVKQYIDKKNTYKHWSDVKEADSMKPYLATGSSFNPGCKGINAGRKKRSTSSSDPETIDFTVGSDGECSGKPSTDYCNGQLQSGREYKIKAYVCTVAGCTETAYSAPLQTEANPLVPALAGTAAALVVIVIIVIVTLTMKRKQTGCFKKDIEGTSPDELTTVHATPMDTIGRRSGFVPKTISLASFPDFVSTLHKDTNLLFSDAYKLLKESSPALAVTMAESQACRAKNRYTNILPFDHSRVKLLPLDDEDGSDFINANYIPGYTSRREYIAAQGPMTATQDDFWRMVWEQNVDIIVMLTKLVEKGRNKCDKYWPELNEPMYYGDLVISIQSESNLSDYTIRIIEVKLGSKTLKVKHFHYLQWPDFGCPSRTWPVINFIAMKEERRTVRQFCYLKWPDMGCPEDPTALLSFVKTVKQHRSGRQAGPMIVHCSAGVGRTGTFIAVDHLLQHIRDHDEVDIYSLVLEMRRHRCNMVQTEDQFVYIHECLKEFITTDEENEEDDDEPTYENTNMRPPEDNVYENTAFSKE